VFYHPLVLAAWCGQEEPTSELIDASIREATSRGEGVVMTLADSATAVLQNGLRRHQGALAAAQRACQYEELLTGWVLPELIDVAARSGEQELAAGSVRRLSERTRVCGTEWALGIEARSRAHSELQAGMREEAERAGSGRIAPDPSRDVPRKPPSSAWPHIGGQLPALEIRAQPLGRVQLGSVIGQLVHFELALLLGQELLALICDRSPKPAADRIRNALHTHR
jgi:hypothetical protein